MSKKPQPFYSEQNIRRNEINIYRIDDALLKTYHDVSSYSERLNISNRKLSDVLKLFVGKSSADVIRERIVTEAKRALMYSGQTVQEIAFELGFEDPFYFSKIFKKVTHQSPKDFKIKLQKFT